MTLPLALFLLLLLSSISAIYSSTSVNSISQVKIAEVAQENALIAEGAIHDMLSQISVRANLWREKVNLTASPSAYTEFSPLSYSATNGIPSCAGIACQRSLYPTGGGLIKNFGPIGAEGDVVNNSLPITAQLNTGTLPTADITLNNRSAWVQVERLDQAPPGASSIGADLNTTVGGGAYAGAVRYRITAKSLRRFKGRLGESTLVSIVELPAA